MPAPAADSGTHTRPYLKTAGEEPLPGYVLLEPLGRGGFGEVWKCEAPGGLHKAVKFVAGGGDQFRQELSAFEQIRAIRHPFLLTLERVELVNGELVMVMELADHQLQDRYRECVSHGLPGIPRDELLAYLADAAEALDVIGGKHGLQHLDVKPANLFLIAGHVKVGDYGLVSRLEGKGGEGNRGLTPKYVAPEVLRGTVDTRSDQYSLALVYVELLTGAFPYSGRSPQQLMMQHVTTAPDLGALPEVDRPIVAQALAKKPGERFPSCVEFVRTLLAAGEGDGRVSFRMARLDRTADPTAQTDRHPIVDPSAVTGRYPRPGDASPTAARSHTGMVTKNYTLPSFTLPGRGLPPLVSGNRRPGPQPPVVAPPPGDDDLPLAEAEPLDRVRLDPIKSVVPVVRLLGPHWAEVPLDADMFTAAVVVAAAGGATVPQLPGDIGRRTDGTWVCAFPSTVPPQVVPLKLEAIRDQWDMTPDLADPLRLVYRKAAPSTGWFSGKKGGLEVVVALPKPGKALGEVAVTGGVVGTTDQTFARAALDALPRILTDIRTQLRNVEDRRKHPRLTATFPVSIYPLHSDGGVDPAIPGRCKDVSVGGLGFTIGEKLQTKYVYVAFETVPATAGLAVLVRLLRGAHSPAAREHVYGGQFRTDL